MSCKCLGLGRWQEWVTEWVSAILYACPTIHFNLHVPVITASFQIQFQGEKIKDTLFRETDFYLDNIVYKNISCTNKPPLHYSSTTSPFLTTFRKSSTALILRSHQTTGETWKRNFMNISCEVRQPLKPNVLIYFLYNVVCESMNYCLETAKAINTVVRQTLRIWREREKGWCKDIKMEDERLLTVWSGDYRPPEVYTLFPTGILKRLWFREDYFVFKIAVLFDIGI